MSLSICADCLSRLRIAPRLVTSIPQPTATSFHPRSAFHSSAPVHRSPTKPKAGKVQMKYRIGQASRLKKKARDQPKPPPIGERKTQRKRIVLSNTNALEVQGMQDLGLENMTDRTCVGKVLGLNGPLLDQLRDAKAFKTTQNWALFRRPATLVRHETVTLAEEMLKVLARLQTGQPETIQRLVVGGKASGKSILQLQAMYLGFMNKFVVITVPEASEFTRNTFAYAPIHSKDGAVTQAYSQSTLSSELLQRAAHANESLLKTLRLNHPLPKTIRLNSKAPTLYDLALSGADDPNIAHSAWKVFWNELTIKGNNARPPVLISIDGIDHWMGPSKYRAADYSFIHAQQFYVVNQLTNILFANESPLAHGGVVLATTSASSTPAFESFNILLKQMRFLQDRAVVSAGALPAPSTEKKEQSDQLVIPAADDLPMPPAYFKSDDRVLGLLSQSQRTKLSEMGGLGKLESRGLLEYFARSGVFQSKVSETVVGELWGLSSGGLVGELARLGSRIRR